MRSWLIIPAALVAFAVLGGGFLLGDYVGSDPAAQAVTSTVKGKVVTENGIVKVKVPPHTTTVNGKVITTPGTTLSLPGGTQFLTDTLTTTKTVNGTVFVTTIKTGPGTTVTATTTTTVTGPGGTQTLTVTDTVPGPTQTVTETQTVTDTQTVTETVTIPPVT